MSSSSSTIESGTCPICATPSSTEFHRDTGKKSLKRLHLLCNNCLTIFVPPSYYVTNSTEKSRYDTHENDSEQEGYRNFLKQSVRPLILYLCMKASDQSKLQSVLQEEDHHPNTSTTKNTNDSRYFARHFTQPRQPRKADQQLSPEQEQENKLINEGLELERKILEETRAKIISKKLENGSECCSNDNEDNQKNQLFKGLDFGCGPGPTLNKMILSEIPFLVHDPVALYDKYYFPEEEGVFYQTEPKRRERETENENDSKNNTNRQQNNDNNETKTNDTLRTPILYDFITATEVAEHIAEAGKELTKLWSHVKPNGGVLIIQTSRTEAHCAPVNEKSIPAKDEEKQKLEQVTGVNLSRYGQWHYIRDDTHICFFHMKSFEYLRQQWGSDAEHMIVCGPSVVMFVKK